MRWFYAVDKEQLGPLARADIDKLVSEGTITDKTMVWTDGMKKWLPFGQVKVDIQAETANVETIKTEGVKEKTVREEVPATVPDKVTCSECDGSLAVDEIVKYGDLNICAACKPAFFQKVKEGKSISGEMIFGGFWIRFGAKFLDGIITGIFNTGIVFTASFMLQGDITNPAIDLFLVFAPFAITIAYATFFVGRFQATPGKMATGLIIVSPDGNRISYLRAFCRHLAEIISSIILLIGYIMAAFDKEKRTLHDRICSTRVIKKRV